MRSYSKPLRGGGSRIIPRSSGGQFARAVLDCKVCTCGSINVPEFVDERETGGFVTKRYPTNCNSCGARLT